MKRLEVAPGDRYGRLTIIEEVEQRGRYRFVRVCCDCGTTKIVGLNDLRSGQTSSCGCYRNERVKEATTTHGWGNTSEYQAWWDMVARCTNKDHPSYKDYGGRGITVYAEWMTDLNAFIAHVGPKPSADMSLDRINNDLGYFPGNVRWTTRSVNQNNRRVSKIWIIDGFEFETLRFASIMFNKSESTLKQWCKGWKCYRTGKIYPPRENCGFRSTYE